MPAFRGKNFRSGDLAEQLGILLLQSVALVAPIPRTEDIGIDVVVTLLRDFDGYKYIAEDSCFIQLKSDSITEIVFKGDEVTWLANLKLPFFIGVVERKTSSIRLYTTHDLSHFLIEQQYPETITLHLTSNPLNLIDTDIATLKSVPLGPHILEWSIDTVTTNNDFQKHFYKIMKPHIEVARLSMETRSIGSAEMVSWSTDTIPVVSGNISKPVGSIEELNKKIAPYLQVLLQRQVFGEDILTVRSLYRLLEKILDMNGQFEVIDGKRQLKEPTTYV